MKTLFLKRFFKRLKNDKGGNTLLLVAIGMPMLIGGAGLGVDLAQWYMWKRELQYAVDQAAIAGAWARTQSSTESTYVTRATQEFNANLQITKGHTSTPVVALANYAAGSANSVTVHATTSRSLPFSSFLTGHGTTIYAYAQASFSAGQTFTSCLIATSDHDSGAITLGGSTILTANCGLAALSDAAQAITVNGNPTIDAGWILAKGGIDDWLKTHTDDVIIEHAAGLTNPFAALTPPSPPSSQVSRTYACNSTPASTTATKTTAVSITYSYWKGANANGATAYNYTPAKPPSSSSSSLTNQSVPNGTVAGSQTPTTSSTMTQIAGSGNAKIYEKATTTTTVSYSNIVVTPGTSAGTALPGTYGSIDVSCNTTFQTGIYVINGGRLKITGQYAVNGAAVMFVLKNGAYIDIAGGSNINLTAMTTSDLIAQGVSSTDANKLSGMLVFEDPHSPGSNKFAINGNASTVLNGTIYMPVSTMNFSGTATVTSQCLMIAAHQINITGNTNMSTFCPAGVEQTTTVLTTNNSVKLVA
ncbi:MAG: pilus assembly protein TadG-related protein [Croceibacterium sp.]